MTAKKKRISQQATDLKGELQPLVDKYVNLMLDDLLAKDLIQELIDQRTGKSYILKDQHKVGLHKPDLDIDAENDLGPETILDFRDLIQSIYFSIHEEIKGEKESVKVSSIVEEFHNAGIIKVPQIESTRLKDILDKGKILLNSNNADIQKEASELLDIQNNHIQNVNTLLEYYVKEEAKRQLLEFSFQHQYRIGSSIIDLVANHSDEDQPNILFDVRYRKKALSSLRNDLITSVDQMSRYDRTTPKDTYLIMVIFTDDGSDTIEKMIYRFRQYVEESFPSLVDNIFMIALYIKNSHLLKDSFKTIISQIINTNSSTTELYLQSLGENLHKEKDDILYEKIFDLTNCKYEITVKPKILSPQWRVGLRFSQSQKFPSRTERHVRNYHLFHAEKNADSQDLKMSYYSPANEQVFAKPTAISEYQGESFTFRLSLVKSIVRIEVLDKNRDPITDSQLLIDGYPFFMLSAWADGLNEFDFQITVKEKRLKLRQGVIEVSSPIKSDSIAIKVEDDNGHPIGNCHVVLLAENNTFHEVRTSESGQCELVVPIGMTYSALIAHENYLSTILDRYDSKNDLIVILKNGDNAGSVIFPSGTGYIPGLEGRLNPILDTSLRTYLYASNIAIDGGKQQPVTFEIDKPLAVQDKNGISKDLLFRFIRGTCSVIDFISNS